MRPAFICDAIRTPIGRYGGALANIRTDDLAALPIRALLDRNPAVEWDRLDDVVLGCANQAGEDNRNVARMALLLAGLPVLVPGVTINRLCGSGLEAVSIAARAIAVGDADLVIAGGVESMSRAPFVLPKASQPFARQTEIHDTTLGWRLINPRMQQTHGVDSLAITAEVLSEMFHISREAQDAFALWSQNKAAAAVDRGLLTREILPVKTTGIQGEQAVIARDEHPRNTSANRLARLAPITHSDGTVTAGNSTGINDGAAGLLLASESAIRVHRLSPRARIVGSTVVGVEPRTMGLGPVYATRRLLHRLGSDLRQFDILEINEAFAVQVLACLQEMQLESTDPRINPLGGAIALGHPLGMSGARLVGTATYQLETSPGLRALCTMCIGVGQGIALVLERAN